MKWASADGIHCLICFSASLLRHTLLGGSLLAMQARSSAHASLPGGGATSTSPVPASTTTAGAGGGASDGGQVASLESSGTAGGAMASGTGTAAADSAHSAAVDRSVNWNMRFSKRSAKPMGTRTPMNGIRDEVDLTDHKPLDRYAMCVRIDMPGSIYTVRSYWFPYFSGDAQPGIAMLDGHLLLAVFSYLQARDLGRVACVCKGLQLLPWYGMAACSRSACHAVLPSPGRVQGRELVVPIVPATVGS